MKVLKRKHIFNKYLSILTAQLNPSWKNWDRLISRWKKVLLSTLPMFKLIMRSRGSYKKNLGSIQQPILPSYLNLAKLTSQFLKSKSYSRNCLGHIWRAMEKQNSLPIRKWVKISRVTVLRWWWDSLRKFCEMRPKLIKHLWKGSLKR